MSSNIFFCAVQTACAPRITQCLATQLSFDFVVVRDREKVDFFVKVKRLIGLSEAYMLGVGLSNTRLHLEGNTRRLLFEIRVFCAVLEGTDGESNSQPSFLVHPEGLHQQQ